jgi:hypothetical protein
MKQTRNAIQHETLTRNRGKIHSPASFTASVQLIIRTLSYEAFSIDPLVTRPVIKQFERQT